MASAWSFPLKGVQEVMSDGISANSAFGRDLLSKARRLDDHENESDMSFISEYAIKFLGCHHVTQWNEEGEGEDNSRIVSKGLVRFRLCKADSCSDKFSFGCSSQYGEYVVDMVQFLEVYVAWQIEEQQYRCATYRKTCYKECYQSASSNCYSNCYKNYGVDIGMCQDNNGNGFDITNYVDCAEYDDGNGNDDVEYYLGPYCANQGGDIRLGFFSDDTCTIPSSKQADYFEKLTNQQIPYTRSSLVTSSCMSCELKNNAEGEYQNDYYNYDKNGNRNYYEAHQVNNLCASMYMASGKCEKNMDNQDQPYPEQGACAYIEGIKMLKTDGIIRSDASVKSKPAAIAIGVFSGVAVLLCGYVYYLKSKIARSRVNLAGATHALT